MRLRFLIFIPAIIMLLGLSACDTPEEKYETHMERGQGFFENNDFVKARLEYRNAAKIMPTDHRVIYHLGQIEEAEGNIQSALAAYLMAEEQKADYEPVLIKLAQFFLTAKRYDEVTPRINKVLSANPNNATAHAIQGSVLLGNRQFIDAQTSINTALNIDSRNIIANAVQAGIYMAMDNKADALKSLDNAIANHPEELSYHLLKAAIYNEQGKIDNVIQTYNNIFTLYPERLNFRIDLARVLEEYNRKTDIEQLYRETVNAFPDNLLIKRNLALFLEQEQGLGVAEAEIQSFVQNDPDQKVFYLWLSDLYVKNGDNDKAITTLKNVLDSNPDNLIGLNASTNLARIELEQGDMELAETLINTVLEKDTNNQDALLLRANLAFTQGDYQKAVSDLRTILQFGSNTLRASRILAEALIIQDRLDLAIDTLIQAVARYPKNSETMIRLAQLYALRGNALKAEEILNAIAKNDPQNPLILETMARLHIQNNALTRAQNAVQSLSKIDGQTTTATYLNALILNQSNQVSDAISLYKQVIENDPNAPIAAYALSSLMEAVNDEASLNDVRNFLLSLPVKTSVIHTVIGGIEQSLGQDLEAEQAFRLAIANNPETQAPFISLARMMRANGAIESAIEILSKAETTIPHEINAPMFRAQILMETNQNTQGIAVYEDLLSRQDNIDVVANNFAHSVADFDYQNIERLDKARIVSERFINSDNPLFLDTLGWVYYRQALYAQAEPVLARAVALLDTPNPQIDYHYGAVLMEVGKTEQAKIYLERAVSDESNFIGRDNAQQLLDQTP